MIVDFRAWRGLRVPACRVGRLVRFRRSGSAAAARFPWFQPGPAVRFHRPIFLTFHGLLICACSLLNFCAGRQPVAPAQRWGTFFLVKCQSFYNLGPLLIVFLLSFVKVPCRSVVPPRQLARGSCRRFRGSCIRRRGRTAGRRPAKIAVCNRLVTTVVG